MNKFSKTKRIRSVCSGIMSFAIALVFVWLPEQALSESLTKQVVTQHLAAFTIATGRPGSTHAQVGEIICNVYNRRRSENGARCRTAYSPGGRQQLTDMLSDKVQMAIIQSDVVAAAYSGQKQFNSNDQLRVLLPLHEQTIATVIRGDAPEGQFDVTSLTSKRVAMSASIRDGRYTLRRLFVSLGLDFVNVNGLIAMSPANQIQALCDDRIDVGFMLFGHPNGAIQQGIHDCKVRFVPYDFPHLRTVVESSRYLQMGEIPKGTYTGQTDDITAPAVATLLVTTDRFDLKTGKAFIEVLLENQSILRRLHRSLSNIDLNRRPALARQMKHFGEN